MKELQRGWKKSQKGKVYWTREEPRKGIIKRVNRYLNRRRYYWRKVGKKPRTEFEWEELLKQQTEYEREELMALLTAEREEVATLLTELAVKYKRKKCIFKRKKLETNEIHK